MMEAGKLTPGTLLQNRYRILSLLKQGGMGAVYLAEDRRFRSQVAVKEARFTQEKLCQAFAHEAELLHRLRHPALPHVTDHFTEVERQYLVMQFIPGKDLEELLTERMQETGGAFAVEQVLDWADQLLDALEYLHGHQPPIVHRDIKPQNLKLTERGEVILLDFGLAKGAATEMSQVGTSLPGYTCHYAPLEQMRGAGTDTRSDLYALAATVYRLITGQLPPDALTRAMATLERRPDPLLPINKLNVQVLAGVAAVLSRALAQLPDERPATATEMRRALRAARQSIASGRGGASIFIDEALAKDSPLTLPDPEPGDLTTRAMSAGELARTNAGQLLLSQAPGGRSAPDVQAASVTSVWSRIRSAWTARIALGVLLLASTVLAYWLLNRPQVSVVAQPPPTDAADVRSSSPTPTPTHFVEVMRYYLQVESDGGRAERVAGPDPVVTGRYLKFHFKPGREGYLYIVAPGEREARTTFLTAQPNPVWGVKSNLLAAEAYYSFPPRRIKWIEISRGAGSGTYTVIFAPKLLAQPGFLAKAAGRELTAAEEGELAELQKQYGQQVRLETLGSQSVIAVPAERASGEPLLFEIELRRSNQEGGKRQKR
jgi:serine/threonine protein kinase